MNHIVGLHIDVETANGERWRITPHIRDDDYPGDFTRLDVNDVVTALQRRMEVTITTPFGVNFELIPPDPPGDAS